MEIREKQILMATPTMHKEEMEFIQEAFDKNVGTYGRYADAVKYIDPRHK